MTRERGFSGAVSVVGAVVAMIVPRGFSAR